MSTAIYPDLKPSLTALRLALASARNAYHSQVAPKSKRLRKSATVRRDAQRLLKIFSPLYRVLVALYQSGDRKAQYHYLAHWFKVEREIKQQFEYPLTCALDMSAFHEILLPEVTPQAVSRHKLISFKRQAEQITEVLRQKESERQQARRKEQQAIKDAKMELASTLTPRQVELVKLLGVVL
jgi:hypothetical protein